MHTDAFKKLFLRQLTWQYELYESLGQGQRTRLNRDKVVLENLDSAVEEVIEARRNINIRKPWNPNKRDKPMSDNERLMCAEEIIDVFHFLMTSLIYLDMNYDDIQAILIDKIGFNDKREDHSNVK